MVIDNSQSQLCAGSKGVTATTGLFAGKLLRRLGLLSALILFPLLHGCANLSGNKQTNDKDASQFNAELGAKYLQRGELDQARLKLEKALEQDDDNALAHISYARLQQRIGNADGAAKHFELAIKLQPEAADHQNSYGVFLCEQNDLEGAQEQFRKAASNPYYKTPWFALDNAGLCLLDADDLDGAETWLRDALRENPRFANALLHMSDLTFRQQRLTIADAYYGRFREYGNDSAASLLLGMNIRRALGDLQGAKIYAEKLLNNFPDSREAGEYLTRPL